METPSAERKRPGSGRANGKGGSSPAAGGPSAPDRRGQAPAAAATGAAAPAERDGSGPAGTTGGVLESRDELHSSFHRAMAEAAAAEEAARSAAAAETARRYAAEAAGKRRAGSASAAAAQGAQPAQPAPSKGSAAAVGATDGTLAGAEGGRGEGILASLRRRQEEHSGAQRSLAGLGARAKGGRWAAACCGALGAAGWCANCWLRAAADLVRHAFGSLQAACIFPLAELQGVTGAAATRQPGASAGGGRGQVGGKPA